MKSVLWDLLVAYVVSVHFYNIVFIYLPHLGGHKEKSWGEASKLNGCFSMLLGDCAVTDS